MRLKARQEKIAEQHSRCISSIRKNKLNTVVRDFSVLAKMREFLEEEIIKKCNSLGMDDLEIKLVLDRAAERAKFFVDMNERFSSEVSQKSPKL